MLEKLVDKSLRNVDVKDVICDEAYDSRRNFNILDDKGIEPIIRVRRNTVKRLRLNIYIKLFRLYT